MADENPLDRLISAIKSASPSKPSVDDDFADDGADTRGRVPYSRFAAKVAEVRELRAQLDRFGTELGKVKQAHAAELKAIREASAKQVTTLAQQHADELSLVEAGFMSPIQRAAAKAAHAALPEAGRPALGDLVKQWQAKPEEAPAELRGWIAPAGKQTSSAGSSARGQTPPPTQRGVVIAPADAAAKLAQAKDMGELLAAAAAVDASGQTEK